MVKIVDHVNNNLIKIGLKPLHPCTICFYYIPMKGWISYTLLSTQMLSPELYTNFSFILIPKYISFTNACLVQSLLGTSLHLFSRPHLMAVPMRERIGYCLFGSAMFNLGSMLLWALSRTVAPESSALRFMIGFSGAIGVLWFANKYVNLIDQQVNTSSKKQAMK